MSITSTNIRWILFVAFLLLPSCRNDECASSQPTKDPLPRVNGDDLPKGGAVGSTQGDQGLLDGELKARIRDGDYEGAFERLLAVQDRDVESYRQGALTLFGKWLGNDPELALSKLELIGDNRLKESLLRGKTGLLSEYPVQSLAVARSMGSSPAHEMFVRDIVADMYAKDPKAAFTFVEQSFGRGKERDEALRKLFALKTVSNLGEAMQAIERLQFEEDQKTAKEQIVLSTLFVDPDGIGILQNDRYPEDLIRDAISKYCQMSGEIMAEKIIEMCNAPAMKQYRIDVLTNYAKERPDRFVEQVKEFRDASLLDDPGVVVPLADALTEAPSYVVAGVLNQLEDEEAVIAAVQIAKNTKSYKSSVEKWMEQLKPGVRERIAKEIGNH